MVKVDKLIANAETIAAAAKRVGLDDIAAASHDDIRLFRALKDGFRRAGEDI